MIYKAKFGKDDIEPDGPDAREWKVYHNDEFQGTVVGNDVAHVMQKMYFGLTDIEPKAGAWSVE